MNSTPSFECARSCRVLLNHSLHNHSLRNSRASALGLQLSEQQLCSAAFCGLETPWKSGIRPAQHAAPPASLDLHQPYPDS